MPSNRIWIVTCEVVLNIFVDLYPYLQKELHTLTCVKDLKEARDRIKELEKELAELKEKKKLNDGVQ